MWATSADVTRRSARQCQVRYAAHPARCLHRIPSSNSQCSMSDEIALQMTVGIEAGPRDSKHIRKRSSAHCVTAGELTRSDIWEIPGCGASRIPGSFSKVSPSSETALNRCFTSSSEYGSMNQCVDQASYGGRNQGRHHGGGCCHQLALCSNANG